MIGIAFDLRRPAFVAAHEDRYSGAKQRRSRRVEESFTRNVFFRLFHVRNNLLGWLKNTTTQARQRERRPHQLDECATLDRIVPLFRLLRKLTRHKLTKHRRISQFFKTAPEFLAAARFILVLQRQDVVAHQLKIYVTIAITHSTNLSMASGTTLQHSPALDLVPGQQTNS